MNANLTPVRATPFHTRAAEANEGNDWTSRNAVTLARVYACADGEALAARFRVGLIDISWRWRVAIEGARAGEFLSRLVTRDVSRLAPGQSVKALWLSDGGGVRGAGVVARLGSDDFLIVSAAPDADWIERAAAYFSVSVRDVSAEMGGLALAGPYAAATLARAGLEAALEPLAFRKLFWRGLDVTLSRWGEQGGYEIWCAADDGIVLWDRLMRAGGAFGIEPMGLAAADVLDVEAGIARPFRDYVPARDGFATVPAPRTLGLESLIDGDIDGFNGHSAWRAGRDGATRRLIGVEIESDILASYTPLFHGGRAVGRTLTSVYSPALRRAIALAEIDAAVTPGSMLTLTLPPSAEKPDSRTVAAHIADLPFLPVPACIEP